jgi:hypothetical protein
MNRNPLKLDEEELHILRDFERGEFESIRHFEKRSAAREQPPKERSKRISASTFVFPPGTWKSYKNGPSWKGFPDRH